MADFKKTLQKKTPRVFGSYHLFRAWSAAKRYRNPSGKMFVIGITGTKGKTTTLEVLNAILERAGKRTALLSSLRVKVGDATSKNGTGNSMPGKGYIQNFLHRAVADQCSYALIEVTSQGVVGHRHRFIDWNIGVLTNLAPEHIESHGSFEKYRAAKLAFLTCVARGGGTIFLNRDDASFPFFADALRQANVIPYSRTGRAFADYLPSPSPVRSAAGDDAPHFLLSDFNKENIACAVSIAKELGIGDDAIKQALLAFEGVPGRMHFIKVNGYTAVVDYAHTPESLAAAYRAVKPAPTAVHPDPKLFCVLGAAGGGRDTWKRPEFGSIACSFCDEIFLTEEDPYDEDPDGIIREIRSGMSEVARVHVLPDRRAAIRAAVDRMRDGDVVIGTGKGSEEWIHRVRGTKTPWNEQEVFKEALLHKNGDVSG